MSSNPESPSDSSQSILLALVLITILGAGLWKSYGASFQAWRELNEWKLTAMFAVCAVALAVLLTTVVWNLFVKSCGDSSVTEKDETSVLLGIDESGAEVHLKQSFRISHTQIIGTTNAGKTESVILPWAIRDIESGAGLLIVDGKGDRSFLDKLYAYVAKSKRTDSFKLFSLAHIEPSSTFNPLMGGTATEVSQRVFSSFPIEHPHYRATQSVMFQALLTLILDKKKLPTFQLVHSMLSDAPTLDAWLKDYELINKGNCSFLNAFNKLPRNERSNEVSGLNANLMPFVYGPTAALFNSTEPQIDFDAALKNRQICYFQLPTMYCPFLAEATGKLVLQCFQQAVAKRQLHGEENPGFFSCFLDDFQDYIYPGFGALLNKSRSANIGVVFSHQALGDLDKVGPEFRNVVTTCTNVKVVMRTTEPETCEFYAKTFGTESDHKVTERQTRGLIFTNKTGEGSVRDVEKYVIHPNTIRRLERGQGIVSIPHPSGVKLQTVRFKMRPNLSPVTLPPIDKKTS